jgi:molybdopterin-guanine dinucleotide biosynthesis protein A
MKRVLPVVLTGGRSSRFGRDKLREPFGGGLLVDVPVRSLRAVFGGPVALAGACDAGIAERGDLVIADRTPGAGPIGGIVAALEHPLGAQGVFVLAGDLAAVTDRVVRAIWETAEGDPDAWAVLAHSGRPEPCVGVYRPGALASLLERLAGGRRSLHDALPTERVRWVPVEAALVRNVNTVSEL